MNYITESARMMFSSIARRKRLFIFLVILQIVCITLLSIIFFTYFSKILININTITTPYQDTLKDTTTESTTQSPQLLNDALTLYQNYTQLWNNLLSLLFWSFITFLLGNGLLWSISHEVLQQKQNRKEATTSKQNSFFSTFFNALKTISHSLLKFIITSILIILPITAILYFFISRAVTIEIDVNHFSQLIGVSFITLLIACIFLLYCSAFIRETSWKSYIKNIFFSFKKIHYTVPILFINGILLFSILYFLPATINNPSLNTIAIFLTFLELLLLVLTRLFWISTLHTIIKNKHNQEP